MAAPAEEQQQENKDGSTFDRLTGTQKSAILMMLIGEDVGPITITEQNFCLCALIIGAYL